MSVNKSFKKDKWLDAKYKPSGNQYNRSRRKDPELKCINSGKKVFCNKVGAKKTKPKSAKEAIMSRAKAPARRPKTMKRAFKPKPKPKPRSDAMAKAYMSQVGQFLFRRDKEKMSSSDYKKYINKKVKDMSIEEKRQYGKLRTRESRARAKAKK